jgi:hypothetical protein
MNVKMLSDANFLLILSLLDDVEQSMGKTMQAARHKQLWDEDEVPLDAWREDVKSVLKLLDGHL